MLKAIIYSDAYMPLVATIIIIALWKSLIKDELVIVLYCLFNTILFAIADMLQIKSINNLAFYHVSSLVELWLVSFYILKKITGKKLSLSFWGINIFYTCYFILNVTFWEHWIVFNSNSAGLTSLIIMFLSMYYLLQLSKSDEILYFQKLPSFWIASGFLIYNAVSILVLLSYKYFLYEKMFGQGNNLWVVLSAANIIKFALISTGLLCHRKRQTIHLPFLL